SVNAALLWKWFGAANDTSPEASAVETPGAEPAAPSTAPLSTTLPSAAAVAERQQFPKGVLWPDTENRAAGSLPPPLAGSRPFDKLRVVPSEVEGPEYERREAAGLLASNGEDLASDSAAAKPGAASGGRLPVS